MNATGIGHKRLSQPATLLAKVASRRSAIMPGVLAGVAGTAAMDAVLYFMYRRSGGKQSALAWEFSAGVDNWGSVSSPGLVGKAVLHRVLGHEPPNQWARSTQNVVHWATGIGWSTQLALVAGAGNRLPRGSGLTFGATAWLASYVVLPFGKIYKPFWEYDYETLAKDLGPISCMGLRQRRCSGLLPWVTPLALNAPKGSWTAKRWD